MKDARAAAATALVAGLGALAAQAAGLPAAPLIGASVAVSLAAWAGARMRMPTPLRSVGFAAIGVSLGAGVEPTMLDAMGEWAVSLGLLVLSLAATLWAATAMLRRIYGQDAGTSVLASSPGTMSYAIAAAEEGRGDIRVVLILQSLRLFLLASAVPLATFFLLDPRPPAPPPALMGLAELAVMLALALGLGKIAARAGAPAALLVSGMIVSGLAHVLGLSVGRSPGWAVFLSLAITGAAIGARFTGMARGALLSLVGAGLTTVGVASAVSAVFAFAAARLTALPFGQVWVAFAPGGVEAMAAICLALGYDPGYVALHHLVRILVLVVMVPLALRLASRGS